MPSVTGSTRAPRPSTGPTCACSRCRRRHHVLEAVYRGPDPSTSGINISASDREFAAILRRVLDEQPLPWYQRLAQTSGVVILATTAVALAVPLVVLTDEPAPWKAP